MIGVLAEVLTANSLRACSIERSTLPFHGHRLSETTVRVGVQSRIPVGGKPFVVGGEQDVMRAASKLSRVYSFSVTATQQIDAPFPDISRPRGATPTFAGTPRGIPLLV